jgi:hypothetical protein
MNDQLSPVGVCHAGYDRAELRAIWSMLEGSGFTPTDKGRLEFRSAGLEIVRLMLDLGKDIGHDVLDVGVTLLVLKLGKFLKELRDQMRRRHAVEVDLPTAPGVGRGQVHYVLPEADEWEAALAAMPADLATAAEGRVGERWWQDRHWRTLEEMYPQMTRGTGASPTGTVTEGAKP